MEPYSVDESQDIEWRKELEELLARMTMTMRPPEYTWPQGVPYSEEAREFFGSRDWMSRGRIVVN